MEIRVEKDRDKVISLLPAIEEAADQDKEALGFLPSTVYEDHAWRGRLWVAMSPSGNYVGHLLFGGTFPTLKVLQILVRRQYRQRGIGHQLIAALISYGERHQFLAIKARVADDLPANRFWEGLGFESVKQVAGGRTTGRLINIRVLNLDVPTLFDLAETPADTLLLDSLEYQERPTIPNPRFAIDLNILFDVLRRPERQPEASSLLRLALLNVLQLVVTTEVENELLRSHDNVSPDPLIKFVKQLPVLPPVGEDDLRPLTEELRTIVFPQRRKDRRGAQQDKSDLTHLATCIHHRISGFVTRESALLRVAQDIRSHYRIEILGPEDFLEEELDSKRRQDRLTTFLSGRTLTVRRFSEGERSKVESFLAEAGMEEGLRAQVLTPGLRGSARARVCAFSDQLLIGVAAWDITPLPRQELSLFLFVNEDTQDAVRFIDHVLESVSLQQPLGRVRRIILHHWPSQTVTRTTALERGFRKNPVPTGQGPSLMKIAIPGLITEDQWQNIARDFRRLTGMSLPDEMPTRADVAKKGLTVLNSDGRPVRIDTFAFDTAISPGICLYPGLGALIMPIRPEYAKDLLLGTQDQMRLMFDQEALFRIERAYFRASRGSSMFTKGAPLFFYESAGNGGAKALIACARVTSTSVGTVDDVRSRYGRQGVLSVVDLQERADQKGRVHVLTFDNLIPVRRQVPFSRLRELGCVGGANLVTTERIAYQKVLRLAREAFPPKEEE